MHIWKSSIVGALHNPLGAGIGEFRFEIWKYIDFYLQRMVNMGYIVIQHAHNEYLEYLFEGGILFLIFFLLIFYYVLKDKRKQSFVPYTLTGSGLIALFSFPFHMPVSLFHTFGVVAGSPEIISFFRWKKNRIIKAILLIFLLFYSYQLYEISVAEFHSRSGITYIIRHKYDKGENQFTLAIEHFSYEPNYFYNRAVCRENMGMTEGAIRDLRRAIYLSPYEPQNYRMLGVLLLKKGEKRGGIKYLEKYVALTKYPLEFQIVHFIIAGSLDVGDIKTADKYMKIALKYFSDKPVIMMDYFALLLAEKKNKRAEKIMEHIMRRYKNLPPEFYLLQAQLYQNLGKSLIEPLLKLVETKPDPQNILTYLHVIQKEKGNKAAYNAMLKILKKNPALLNYILGDKQMQDIFQKGGGKKK